jgi:hypothetical protein
LINVAQWQLLYIITASGFSRAVGAGATKKNLQLTVNTDASKSNHAFYAAVQSMGEIGGDSFADTFGGTW